MATDQVENEPPLSEQQPALPVLNYIEAFRPLVPTEDMQSTSQRLQHIFVTNGSPASFGLVVSKQWRADRANGRNTWAVVGTALEVELLEQDLTSGAAADVPGESIDPEFLWAPSRDERISGVGVVIVTFEHLVAFLGECLQEDRTWQWDASCGSPTVVMNFGWGNMSFEMAFACPLLARLIEDTMLTGPQVIMACTVSSDDRPYFGRSWRHVEMQDVTVLTRGPRITPRYYFTEEMGDVKMDGLWKIKTLLSEISNNNARMEGERSLLLLDESQRYVMYCWGSEPLNADRAERLRGDDAGNIALCSTIPYVGEVGRISDVIIYPFADSFTRDKGQIALCQTVFGIPRSQAEVHYHSRYNQESDTQPQVHIMMNEEYFRLLPVHCEFSPAHTLHLARLLVCCMFIWAEAPLVEIPVLLPEDDSAVFKQLEHLSTKDILDQNFNPFPPLTEFARASGLDEHMALTPLGRTTAAILMKGVRSLHSAHLLAQLLDTSEEYRTLNKTSLPVVEAILAFSVLTEVNESNIPTLGTCLGVKNQPHDDRAWYDDNLRGISQGTAGRGTLWLEAGLWQILMSDYALRGPLSRVIATGWPQNPQAWFNGDRIIIDVGKSVDWDVRLFKFSDICMLFSDMIPVYVLNHLTLADHESLAVEVALVRAYMDRIMMVEYHGEDTAENFSAWDLVSGHTLDLPPETQKAQFWWEDCHNRDERASAERSSVIFCVYSFMLYDVVFLGGARVAWARRPANATHVSARAVQLALEGTIHSWKVEDPMGYLRRLRGRASQESSNQFETIM